MGVDLIPMLIDEKILADEIVRLSKVLPPEKLDHPETQFHHELFYEHGSPRNQYSFAKLDPYKNTKWCIAAEAMRLQLLNKTREHFGDPALSADALFQFFGAFFCSFNYTNPFNEYGFHNSTIIGANNSRRLHLLFQRIDFELLRPVFEEHCRVDDRGREYTYIHSFEELVEYAKALDGLLIQAIENNKVLYIYAG